MKKRIDSTKIAQLVGVSRSTVSKVINNYPNISQETREKVLTAIREYQYVPNYSAQIMAGSQTKTIGLFFISYGEFSDDSLVNLMIASVIEQAAKQGYHILTYIIKNENVVTDLIGIKEVFYQHRVDAGIFIGARNHESVIEELISDGFTVGIFDQNLPGRDEENRIVVNFSDEETAGNVIKYAFEHGHRDIGIINGDLRRNSGVAKNKGFQHQMQKLGLEIKDKWMLYGTFSTQSGYDCTANFLKSGIELPSAFIAANDHIAFGAIEAFTEAGIRIPEDISIIGIDGHPLGAYSRPPLTTFQFDQNKMMGSLVSRTILQIENPQHDLERRMTFYSELVERDSCKNV